MSDVESYTCKSLYLLCWIGRRKHPKKNKTKIWSQLISFIYFLHSKCLQYFLIPSKNLRIHHFGTIQRPGKYFLAFLEYAYLNFVNANFRTILNSENFFKYIILYYCYYIIIICWNFLTNRNFLRFPNKKCERMILTDFKTFYFYFFRMLNPETVDPQLKWFD